MIEQSLADFKILKEKSEQEEIYRQKFQKSMKTVDKICQDISGN